ncbi:MAG: hypothetical protein QXV32_09645 [Conexivisphaerales archaeon]
MATRRTVLAIIGLLLIIGAFVLIALDYSGMGDMRGLDIKDVGVLLIGIILIAVSLMIKPNVSTSSSQTTGQATS